uniref:Putative lipocalin n=1 Tax=Ixodes ricinus TaxID=34613 RepID=A0A6B0UVU2_IXORI
MRCFVVLFLVTLRVRSQSALPPACRSDWFAERIGKYPDGFEVLASNPPLFSLVYQSREPGRGSETPCLHTTDIQLNRSSWLATVTYVYYEFDEEEEARITGHVVASTLHDGNSSISDDTIRFYSVTDPSAELLSIRSQVIYNDRFCILM